MQSSGKRHKELARLEHRKAKEAKSEERKRLMAERPVLKDGDPDPSIEYPEDYQGPRPTPADPATPGPGEREESSAADRG